MNGQATVLIIAESGQVRDGLRALLHAMPGVNVVDGPCGMLSADLLTEHNPDLILVYRDFVGTGSLDALLRFKTQHSRLRFLILVEDVEQARLARDTSADRVLIKGTSAEKLADAVKELLAHHAKQGGSRDE